MTTLPVSLLFLLAFIALSLGNECHPGTIANYDFKNSAGQDVNPLRCMYGVENVGSAVWNSVILSRYPGMYALAPNLVHLPWGTGEHCGKCFELSGPKGHILGVVMDTTTQAYRSPVLPMASDSNYLHFDVTNQALTAVSLIGDNTWEITWHQVPCPWSGNIKYTLTGVYTQTLYFYFFDFLDALSSFQVCTDQALTKCASTVRYGIRFYTNWGTFSSTQTTVYLKLTSQNGQVATGTLTAAQAQKTGVIYSLNSNFKSSVTANSNPCSQHLDTSPIFDGKLGSDFAGGFKWGATAATTGTCPGSTQTCLVFPYPGTTPFVNHYYAPVPAKQFSSLTIHAYATVAMTVNWLINWDASSFGSIQLSFPANQWVDRTIYLSTTAKTGAWVVKSSTIISQIVAQSASSSTSGSLYIQTMNLVPTSAAQAEFDSTLPNVTPWKVNDVIVGADTTEGFVSNEAVGVAITDSPASPTDDTPVTPSTPISSDPDQFGTAQSGLSSADGILFGYIGMMAVVLVIVIISLVILLVVLTFRGTGQRKLEQI